MYKKASYQGRNGQLVKECLSGALCIHRGVSVKLSHTSQNNTFHHSNTMYGSSLSRSEPRTPPDMT